jgi:hypothetical protein
VQLYPYRKWLVASTGLGIVLFVGGGYLLPRLVASFIAALGFATVAVSWTLFCVCYWFEPTKGSLRPDNWLGRHVRVLNEVSRWWGALLASMFVVGGVVGSVWWVLHAVRSA